jgi:hypothetical protein
VLICKVVRQSVSPGSQSDTGWYALQNCPKCAESENKARVQIRLGKCQCVSCKQKTGRWYALQKCPCSPKALTLSKQVATPAGVLARAQHRKKKREDTEINHQAQGQANCKNEEEKDRQAREQAQKQSIDIMHLGMQFLQEG